MSDEIRTHLQAQVDRKLSAAAQIAETAEKSARSLEADEKREIEHLLDAATELKKEIKEIDDRAEFKKTIDEMRGPISQPPEEVADASSIGEAFVKSDNYQTLRKTGMNGQWTTGAIEFKDFDRYGRKATVSQSASAIAQPDVQGGILPKMFERLTVADLMASGTTDSNTVRYLRESTATNAAAGVSEGAAKPESTIIFDQVDEAVRKIATFLPVSDEMLEDESQIQSFLNQRLALFVQIEEERQLLRGTGTAPELSGILDRSGILSQALGSLTAPDAIYQAITDIRVASFLEPDGIVVHPNNWAVIRTAKDDNNQYYGGGPFVGPYGNNGIAPDNIWGLPVVVTQACPNDVAIVGAWRTAAQVFRRNGLTVEASNSHSDFFQKNLTAIRAEERLALAVYRENAFCVVSGLAEVAS